MTSRSYLCAYACLSALTLSVACGDEFQSATPSDAGSGASTTGTATGGDGGGDGGGSALLELGTACATAPECASGFCVDGYCCDNECEGTCRTCDRPAAGGIDGQCRPVEPGIDPADECGDGLCDGAAGCAVGEELFAQACGDNTSQLHQLALDMAVDSNGDVVIVGYYSGDLKIGSVILPASDGTARDIFVAKIDGDTHATLWAFGVGGPGDDDGRGVAVDANNNVYVTGAYQQSFSMDANDPTTPAKLLPNAGTTQNAFIASYDADGAYRWARGAGSSATNTRGNAITVHSDGSLVYVGEYTGTANVGGGALADAGGVDNLFVARVRSSDGVHEHSVGYGAVGADAAAAVAATADGGVWLAGSFANTIDFTPGSTGGQGEFATLTGPDAFLVKLQISASSFDHVASQRFGGEGEQRAFGLAVNSQGQPHVIGEYGTQINIGGTVTAGQGAADVFVARLTVDAQTVIWAKHVSNSEAQSGLDVACDPQGNVYVTGDFMGQIDLGGNPLTSGGSGDVFIAKYHPNGTHLWSRGYGNGDLQSGIALATDDQHRVWLTGKLLNTNPVGFGQAGNLVGAGAVDFFLLQMGR